MDGSPQLSNAGIRNPPAGRLNSWKEIAAYLERDVTTVRRWERELGLPVYRLQRQKLSAVYAFSGEIDLWLQSRTQRLDSDVIPPPNFASTPESLAAKGAAAGEGIHAEPLVVRKRTSRRTLITLTLAALGTGCIAGWYIATLKRPAAEPLFRMMTTHVGDRMVTAAAITADGRRLAYAVQDGTVMVQSIGQDKTTWLPSPRNVAVERLHWFPGNTALCASGIAQSTREPAIWRLSVSGEPPRLLRRDATDCIPSPDGERVAFTSRTRSEIRVMAAKGSFEERVSSAASDESFPVLLWSPDGRRIICQRRSPVPDQTAGRMASFADEEPGYLRTYESRDVQSGSLLAAERGWRMDSAVILPDSRIMFTSYEPGTLTNRIWEVRTDPRTGAFLETPRQVTHRPVFSSGITAAADGRTISAVVQHSSQPDVYIAAVDPVKHVLLSRRRLTWHESEDYPQAWTSDGSALVFESSRNGTYDLFRIGLGGGEPEVLVAEPGDEFMPQFSPDGKWILYASRQSAGAKTELWRVAASGGRPVQVAVEGEVDEFRCPGKGAPTCLLRTIARNEFVFRELDPLRGTGARLVQTAWTPGLLGDWSFSADGKYIAAPGHSARQGVIRVIALNSAAGDGAERLVTVPGVTGLRAIRWAPGGNGWFAAASARPGFTELYFIASSGRARLLREVAGFSWPLPSPDGKLLAYVEHPGLSSNVWTFERQ